MAKPPVFNLPPPTSGGGKSKKQKKQTPAQRAASAAATAQAKAQNPYFQGQLFLAKKQELDTIWEAYTGRVTSVAQARRIISLGWSNYHLQTWLANIKNNPRFTSSPVWKTNAPSYNAIYKNIMGEKAKAPVKSIAYAIVHNLGQTGFEEIIRQSKAYVGSLEFKNNTASMENVYASIMGNAQDPHAQYAIKQATLAGWNSDQFAKYLRSQPQYAQSTEFRNKTDQLASVFGGTPTLTATQALTEPTPYGGNLPNDQRLNAPAVPPPAATPKPKPKPQPSGGGQKPDKPPR